HGEDPWLVAVALGILVYGGAVVRVGGDFMFARLFVPLTPLLALLLEVGVARLGGVRLALGVTTSVVAVMQLVPRPVTGIQWRYGVADGWEYYDPASRVVMLRVAEALHHATGGSPRRVAFVGDARAHRVHGRSRGRHLHLPRPLGHRRGNGIDRSCHRAQSRRHAGAPRSREASHRRAAPRTEDPHGARHVRRSRTPHRRCSPGGADPHRRPRGRAALVGS